MSIILKDGTEVGKTIQSLRKAEEFGMLLFLNSHGVKDFSTKEEFENAEKMIKVELKASYSEEDWKSLKLIVEKIKNNAVFNLTEPDNSVAKKFKNVEF